MSVQRESGAAAWLTVAVTAMAFMGVYAFMIVLARTPVLGPLFPQQEFFKTALITHVVLALVIWFLAFVIFAMHYVTPERPAGGVERRVSWGALLGIGLIVVTPFTGPAYPQLNNYVPTLDRGLYLWGVGIFFVFAVMGAGLRLPALLASDRPMIVRGSLMAAGGALLSAMVCFALATKGLKGSPDGGAGLDPQYYYELLFWGGGHVLQFANTLGLMAVWSILYHRLTGRSPLPDPIALPLIVLVALLIVAAPFGYLALEHDDPTLRRFFILLKAWGLSFGPLILGGMIVKNWRDIAASPAAKRGFGMAIFLFGLGGVIALTIEGSDTRVPAHYHGVIGGVTLSFMTLGLVALTENGWLTVREGVKKFQVTLYGVGQALFVMGLFVGGLAGLGRKTFGTAQQLDTALKYVGMSAMGIGGLLAISSGAMFVVFMIRALRNGGRNG
jgi:hypothetical protein